MGGNAFLIWGDLDTQKLSMIAAKKSILDKILRRKKFLRPEEILHWPEQTIFEVKNIDMDELINDFQDFVHQKVPNPWASTQAFLDYMNMKIISVYLRGEQDPDQSEPEWYIQFTFSGCAGTAEISAELSCHWAEIWFQENRERLEQDHLLPIGFKPNNKREDNLATPTFIPVGHLGYAMYMRHNQVENDPEWPGSQMFELDASITEALDENEELPLLDCLDDLFGPLMSDNKCRCQFCMPGLDPVSLLTSTNDTRAIRLANLK